jgi:hypothetical protein
MDGTEEIHIKQSKPGSKSQRSHVFPHMWKLDLYIKCISRCIYDHTYDTYTHIYSERDNKIVLVSLSEGTTGQERKENVRELKILMGESSGRGEFKYDIFDTLQEPL